MVRADRQRPEPIERETPLREPGRHFLDPVQLGIKVRVLRFFPRAVRCQLT
jgi:hypothetical protein